MNVEVRPATKAEQMYCYTQSDQIMGRLAASVIYGQIWVTAASSSFTTGPAIARGC